MRQRPLFEPPAEGAAPATATLKSASGAPTVYRKRIAEVEGLAQPGDLVKLTLDDGNRVGWGLLNLRAEATIRVLTRGDTLPDTDWWQRTLSSAVALRQDLLKLPEVTDACRLLHGEGDGVPGVVVDRFGDVLVVEAFSLGMYQRGAALADELRKLTGAAHWVVRPGPRTLDQEGFAAEPFSSGTMRPTVTIQEHGVKFQIDLAAGHKTGFFCDQRDNRARLATLTAGKTVLDLCCFTGGFSISAMTRGNAREATGVDLDEAVILQARKNARLNSQQVRYIHADAFHWLRDILGNGRTFDVVVLDPPRLVVDRDDVGAGKRKYYDLNRLAMQAVAPGGLLVTCSCSGLLPVEEFTRTVIAAVPDGRAAQILWKTGAGPDHPIAANCPETEYLKAVWMRL